MWKKAVSILTAMSLAMTGGWLLDSRKSAAETTVSSLDYSFTSTEADTETSGTKKDYTLKKTKYGSKGSGYSFTSGGGKLFASVDGSGKRKLEWSEEDYSDSGKQAKQPVMTAGKKFPWKSSGLPYFEVQVSTAGYEKLSFSAYIGATKKGPRNYQVSYAVGSSDSFSNISGATLSLSDNKKMEQISAELPEAAKNQSLVRIRISASSMTTVEGKTLTDDATGGEAAINHISLKGSQVGASASSTDGAAGNSSDPSGEKPGTAENNAGSGSASGKSGTSYRVKKVKLNTTWISLRKGAKYTLLATVKVKPGSKAAREKAQKKLKWSSSAPKVVKVSKNGKIKARKKGTAVITVKYSKKKKAKCKVVVLP